MRCRFPGGCLAAALLFLACPAGESRAELRLYPELTVSEIYDDNIYNDPRNRVSEFITRLMPSLSAVYEGPRIEADMTYTLDFRHYLRGERGSESVHLFKARGLADLYRETFYLEVEEELDRVSLDAARDFREESLFLNQTDRNLFAISPYFEIEPTRQSLIRGGYRYVRITFDDGGGVDRSDHIFFLEGERELSERTTVRLGAQYLDEESEVVDHRKKDVWTGFRTDLSDDFSVSGRVGYTWIDFADGVNQTDFFWEAALSRDFTWLTASASLGVRYTEDPEGTIFREEYYGISASRDWERSRLAAGASLAEFYETETDDLDTRRYGGSITFDHELTERWSVLAAVSYFHFDDAIEDTETDRFIYHAALSRQLSDKIAATLGYFYIDSHSPELEEDRYRTNRVLLEVHAVF